MHKGVMILVKAENKKDAISQVNDFMEPYGEGDIWDYYRVGGRWTNYLAPKEKYNNWHKKYLELIGFKEGSFGVDCKTLEIHRDKIQKLWKDEGLQGKNPNWYNEGFNFDLPNVGGYYDVLSLSECIDVVKDWAYDYWEKHKELIANAEEWLEGKGNNMFDKIKEKSPDTWYEETEKARRNMYAYDLKRAAEIAGEDFCFDCNVYNVVESDYSVPTNTEGYWVVMIDMHN